MVLCLLGNVSGFALLVILAGWAGRWARPAAAIRRSGRWLTKPKRNTGVIHANQSTVRPTLPIRSPNDSTGRRRDVLMRQSRSRWGLVALVLLPLLVLTRPALGYIDPATGSFLLQVLLGSFLGALLAIKIFWRQIRAFVGKFFKGNREEPKDESPD